LGALARSEHVDPDRARLLRGELEEVAGVTRLENELGRNLEMLLELRDRKAILRVGEGE
jgi:hypothetical protein